jgi:hypothetical protein
MNQESILFPVCGMVTLTILVWVRLYYLRIPYLSARNINLQEYRSSQGPAIPHEIAAPSDNFKNLFETPVLFYTLAALLFASRRVDVTYLALAWGYVFLRWAHSGIHLTYNRVVHRFSMHVGSCLLLWAMWARFAGQLLWKS